MTAFASFRCALPERRPGGLRPSAWVTGAFLFSLLLSPPGAAAHDWNLPALGGGEPLTTPVAKNATVVPVPKRPLSLLDLTDIALQNNPTTRSAWAAVRAQAAALGVARAAYWPQLDATFSIDRRQALSSSGTSSTAQTRYGPGVSLSYLLWDFGARSGAADAAAAELLGARLTRNQTLQDVILEVEQRYYQVQGLTALTDANEKTVASARTSVAAAEKRRVSGLSTVGDVYRAVASLAQAVLTLQQTRGNLASVRGALASAIGLSPDTVLTLKPWSPTQTGQTPARTVSDVLAQARAARPELLAAKAAEQAAIARVRQAAAQGLPSITLSANVGQTRVVDRGTFSNYDVGAGIDIPLFSGFGDRYAREQAEAQAAQAAANTEVLLHQVETEVWQAYQDVVTAKQTLKSSAALLKSAKRAEAVARGRYQGGLDTILDLLTAQATLASARASRVQAQVDYYSSLAVLGHAAGGLPTVPSGGEKTP